jgi:hypothetical protein
VKDRHFRPAPLIGTVLLASLLWFITFALGGISFWVKISVSAAALAGLSFFFQPPHREEFRFDPRAIALGLAAAAGLYLVFWMGKAVATTLFDFAGRQIGGIYTKATGMPMGVIALLLFFVTGPSEEIFW